VKVLYDVSIQNQTLSIVTASEVAEYVFCRHSWYLRRQNTPVTDEAQSRMNAGVTWQDQKDQQVPAALERQAQSKNASVVAWIAVIIFLSLIALWLLHSLLQH